MAFCDYFFRVYRGMLASAGSDLEWMRELLRDSKGWFDIDGDVDSGFDPGVYELRVSVEDARSNKTVQRTAVFSVEYKRKPTVPYLYCGHRSP